MTHLGDITKIDWSTVHPVDVVTGGSPCQDLSIAGKRAGLAGERSGLFMEQIRCVKELRAHDAARGRTAQFIRPRYMVWENVPGAFSSNKGKDFEAVLEETIRIVEPESPVIPVPEKGWPGAGCLGDMDGGWSVAWRVHDAQFWGVPQRRRRIALVADFGGMSAPEILFERKGLSRDSDESGTSGKGAAAIAGIGVEIANDGGCLTPVYCIQGNCIDRADTAGCNGKGWTTNVSYTLNTIDRHAIFCMATGQANAEILTGQSPTLNCNHEQPIVFVYDARGNGNGETVPTITGDHENRVTDYTALVLAFKAGQGAKAGGLGLQAEVSPTLAAGESGTNRTPVILAVNRRNGTLTPDVNGTLQAKSNGGQSLNLNNVILTATEDSMVPLDGQSCTVIRMQVRRLTPLECERLQGYPDGWTDIGPWVDGKGKLHKESSDSARYKALGNSIALPFWKWLLERISTQYERSAQLGSLFDGIGGFPLCWEQINGKGSALWASEIEAFPIAVTKAHFGGEIS